MKGSEWRKHFGETFGNGTVNIPGGSLDISGGYQRSTPPLGRYLSDIHNEITGDDGIVSRVIEMIFGGAEKSQFDELLESAPEGTIEEAVDAVSMAAPMAKPPEKPFRKRIGDRLQGFVESRDEPDWYREDRTVQ